MLLLCMLICLAFLKTGIKMLVKDLCGGTAMVCPALHIDSMSLHLLVLQF